MRGFSALGLLFFAACRTTPPAPVDSRGREGARPQAHRGGREFESLLAIGLTPIEAIRAATIDDARLIGREQRAGSIEPGFDADLVAVTNDVLTSPVPLAVKVVMRASCRAERLTDYPGAKTRDLRRAEAAGGGAEGSRWCERQRATTGHACDG